MATEKALERGPQSTISSVLPENLIHRHKWLAPTEEISQYTDSKANPAHGWSHDAEGGKGKHYNACDPASTANNTTNECEGSER